MKLIHGSAQTHSHLSPVLLAAVFTTALGLGIMLVAAVLGRHVDILPAFVISGGIVVAVSVVDWLKHRSHH